jgi:hypothetical protein
MYLVRFLLLHKFTATVGICRDSGNTLSFTLNIDCHQNMCLSLLAGLNSKQIPFLSFNSKFCVSS